MSVGPLISFTRALKEFGGRGQSCPFAAGQGHLINNRTLEGRARRGDAFKRDQDDAGEQSVLRGISSSL